MPAEPLPLVTYPTPEQWTELLSELNAMTRQLSRIQASIEQAGRQNERQRLRLPRIHLPELPTVTLKGAALTLMVLVVSGILLYASVTLWSVIRPLLQPLP